MPVSVCRPFEKLLESVYPLSHFYKKCQFFRYSFSKRFKVFHTVDYPLIGGERMIMLITRIYALQSNTDLNKNFGASFQR